MKTINALVYLTILIGAMALVAAGVGLFSPNDGRPFTVTTARGDIVQLSGQGLYRYDTPLSALGYQVGDALTLALVVPLLLLAAMLYQRGSLKGGILLAGVLTSLLYTYGSMAIGAAYNDLFLIYVLISSASFFALLLALASFDVHALPDRFSGRLPRRGMAVYLIISGVVLALIWLVLSIVPALLQGTAPVEARYYTTFITGFVDVGIVAPLLIVAGCLLLQRRAIGLLLAAVLLVFTVVLGTGLTVAGIAQLLAGLVTVGQFVGFTVGFSTLTLCAAWFTAAVFRHVEPAPTGKSGPAPTAHVLR